MQVSQESQLVGREEEKLVHAVTIEEDENKLNAVPTIQAETESQQHRDQINKLREKTEDKYYQVKQLTMDNRPRQKKK
jgi:hypothetical protein